MEHFNVVIVNEIQKVINSGFKYNIQFIFYLIAETFLKTRNFETKIKTQNFESATGTKIT